MEDRAALGRRGIERAGNGLTLACAVLAAAPDLDLALRPLSPNDDPQPYRRRRGRHRRRRWPPLARGCPVARVVIMCAGAWATHLLLDWLSADQFAPRGIQLLWPFDGRWFISGWDVFLGSERRNFFSARDR